jgi:deaminated glutathione amidase
VINSPSLNVGVAQYEPTQDIEENLEQTRRLTLQACSSGCDLLVFPELGLTGWGSSAEENTRLAHRLDGELVAEVARLAERSGITLVCGLYEASDNADARAYNTLAVVAPEQALIASHRKMHLYDAFGYRESDEVQRGRGELVTLTMKGTKVGVLNCYEIRFPERAYALAEAGCDILTTSAAWPSGPYKEEHWELNIRARAIENQVWVAGSSSTGPEVIGRSVVVDPLGVVRAQLDASSAQSAVVEMSRERSERARATLPVHAQRRAYYYGA